MSLLWLPTNKTKERLYRTVNANDKDPPEIFLDKLAEMFDFVVKSEIKIFGISVYKHVTIYQPYKKLKK